jgi:hypothetical protein
MLTGCQGLSTPSQNMPETPGRVAHVYQYIVDQNELYSKWSEAASFCNHGVVSDREADGKEPGGRFPSLQPRAKRNAKKRLNRAKEDPVHQLSTATTMISAELARSKPPVPTVKRPVGRPRKPVLDPPPPKRPVGRPRLRSVTPSTLSGGKLCS